jgi:hypothetical protein
LLRLITRTGLDGPGAGDQPLELREHRRHLAGQHVRVGVRQCCVVVRLEDPQAAVPAVKTRMTATYCSDLSLTA